MAAFLEAPASQYPCIPPGQATPCCGLKRDGIFPKDISGPFPHTVAIDRCRNFNEEALVIHVACCCRYYRRRQRSTKASWTETMRMPRAVRHKLTGEPVTTRNHTVNLQVHVSLGDQGRAREGQDRYEGKTQVTSAIDFLPRIWDRFVLESHAAQVRRAGTRGSPTWILTTATATATTHHPLPHW